MARSEATIKAQKKYYTKNREKKLAYQKQYCQDHKEERKRYENEHSEQRAAYARKYYREVIKPNKIMSELNYDLLRRWHKRKEQEHKEVIEALESTIAILDDIRYSPKEETEE